MIRMKIWKYEFRIFSDVDCYLTFYFFKHEYGTYQKIFIYKPKSLNILKGKYLKYKNKTASNALYFIETKVDTGRYKCPDCFKKFTNNILFIEHLEDAHGYPKDMDVEKYYEQVEYKKPVAPNPNIKTYMKYL